MDEKTVEIGQLVAKPRLKLAAPGRLARKMREDWRTLRRLAKKAQARVQSAQGAQNKFNEIGWIVGKAQDRIAARLGWAKSALSLLQADQHRQAVLTAQRSAISALLPPGTAKPACVAIGGGAYLVTLDSHSSVRASIRDSHSNLHEATVAVLE